MEEKIAELSSRTRTWISTQQCICRQILKHTTSLDAICSFETCEENSRFSRKTLNLNENQSYTRPNHDEQFKRGIWVFKWVEELIPKKGKISSNNNGLFAFCVPPLCHLRKVQFHTKSWASRNSDTEAGGNNLSSEKRKTERRTVNRKLHDDERDDGNKYLIATEFCLIVLFFGCCCDVDCKLSVKWMCKQYNINEEMILASKITHKRVYNWKFFF